MLDAGRQHRVPSGPQQPRIGFCCTAREHDLRGPRAHQSGDLLTRIKGGERADAAILTREGIAELAAAGILDGGSAVDLVRSRVGLAVRAGAPRPDIGTAEAFKAALLAARSISYSRLGASGVFFAGLIERLGIADAVNAKATVIPTGLTAEPVARGEVEMAIQQVSELKAVPGVDVVGPLPASLQPSPALPSAEPSVSYDLFAPPPGVTEFTGGEVPVAPPLVEEIVGIPGVVDVK